MKTKAESSLVAASARRVSWSCFSASSAAQVEAARISSCLWVGHVVPIVTEPVSVFRFDYDDHCGAALTSKPAKAIGTSTT